jgi:hypothetical protein
MVKHQSVSFKIIKWSFKTFVFYVDGKSQGGHCSSLWVNIEPYWKNVFQKFLN